MDLRTYRPALPPGTIYRPHTLLERLCRETPPPAPPKQNAKTIIHGRQPATEALPVCLAPETGEQPLPPIQDGPTDAPERQCEPSAGIGIALMMAAAMLKGGPP